MYPLYLFSSQEKIIHDKSSDDERLEKLKFHLDTGDYFPMLATILGFVQETVTECECADVADILPMETRIVRDTRKDLMYLHSNYHIVPKEKVR
jgi:hypothetical protein